MRHGEIAPFRPENGLHGQKAAVNDARMDEQGGRSSVEMTLGLVETHETLRHHPRTALVLGNPPDPAADIESTIQFTASQSRLCLPPNWFCIYTPVRQEGSILLDQLRNSASVSLKRWKKTGESGMGEALMRRDPSTLGSKTARAAVVTSSSVYQCLLPDCHRPALAGQWRRWLNMLSGWRDRREFTNGLMNSRPCNASSDYRRPETTGFYLRSIEV